MLAMMSLPPEYDFAISRRPKFDSNFRTSRSKSNRVGSSPVIGRPQGWRWRAPACGGYGLDPGR
jgi:hypothetical protein